MTVNQIARVCHEANKGLCDATGDSSQKSWLDADSWQRLSAIRGVEYAIANPDAPASAQHEAWSADKLNDGWVYGDIKDPEAKTHPCLVPFDELPEIQQKKDILFKAIVKALM